MVLQQGQKCKTKDPNFKTYFKNLKPICECSPEGESRGHSTGRNLRFLTKPSSTQCLLQERNPAWRWRTDRLASQDVRAPGGCERYWVFTHSQSDCFALQVIKQGSRAAGYEPDPEATAPQFCISTSARTAPSINITFSSHSLSFPSPPLPKADPDTNPAYKNSQRKVWICL